MSAAEKRNTPIPLLVNNSIASSGVRGAFGQITCRNDFLSDHLLGSSHVAVSSAPISLISEPIIEIHCLKRFFR